MKKLFLFVVVFSALTALFAQAADAQVNVTFMLNTATLSDTIKGTSTLRVTGNKTAITEWGDGVALTYVSGDYWTKTIQFNTGDTVVYKYRANGGWESDLEDTYGIGGTPGNDYNRRFIVGTADTTLKLEFYNGSNSRKPQYWRPYEAEGDSMISVWVRVNMQAVMENKSHGWTDADKDSVAIMGFVGSDTIIYSPDANWNASFYIKQESNPYFFSGRVRVRRSLLADTSRSIPYKFRLGYTWGRDELSGQDRFVPLRKGMPDTTLAYVYYSNVKPIVRDNKDTIYLTVNVDMAKAIDGGGFAQGDTVVVQTGFFNTSVENGREKMMNLLISTRYRVVDTIVTTKGLPLDYQYYTVRNGIRVRENYFNFDYKGTITSERERRQINMPTTASKSFTINDFGTSPSDARRQPEFPSQKPLNKEVTVKWIVNLRPAYAKVRTGTQLTDIQGEGHVKLVDSIKVWGVGINGPATNLPDVYPVSDWAPWDRNMVADTSKRKMWDDGTHGDEVSGDTLYTVEFTYPAGTTSGKVYKFGIRGGDNEAGNDLSFGNNHSANISDLNSTYTIYTEWGSINPKFYSEWQYSGINPLGVEEENSQPFKFALNQNYPNPFNPATKINFSLPARLNAKLTVYNVIGQEVATLLNETLDPGNHQVTFNGSILSSGVYFYRLVAGNNTSVKKMMLVK